MEPEEVQEMTVNVVHSDQMNHGGVVIPSSECAVQDTEEEVLVFSVFSTHNKRDTSYPGG